MAKRRERGHLARLLLAMARSARDAEKREGQRARGDPLDNERWEEVVANALKCNSLDWKRGWGDSPASEAMSSKVCVKKSSAG